MTEQNRTDIAVLSSRLERLMDDMAELKTKADEQRTRLNTILGSVVVAAVLLVINAVVEGLR